MAVIFFDGDQTLWDFESIMRDAMGRSLVTLAGWLGLDRADVGTVSEFVADRDTVAAELAGRVIDLQEIRRQGFARSLRRLGIDRPGLADRLTAHYLALRHAESEPYPDVPPALTTLARDHRLGLLTNGNSDPTRFGLADHLTWSFTAVEVGVAKPDPQIYRRVADRIVVPAAELIMVGDSIVNDVVAAHAAGWRAVWLDRPDTARDHPSAEHLAAADAVITGLDQLPAVVARWE